MNSLFDSAGLAIVAYAEVIGANGATSTSVNSGVTTSKIGTGQYNVALATAIPQMGYRDLIFVQPKMASGVSVGGVVLSATVNDDDPINKKVNIGSPSASTVDSDFSILVLRTILP
jgi:hypothetical protein